MLYLCSFGMAKLQHPHLRRQRLGEQAPLPNRHDRHQRRRRRSRLRRRLRNPRRGRSRRTFRSLRDECLPAGPICWKKSRYVAHVAMGRNPVPPVNIPIPTKKKQNGWCSYPKMVPLVLTHSHLLLFVVKGAVPLDGKLQLYVPSIVSTR